MHKIYNLSVGDIALLASANAQSVRLHIVSNVTTAVHYHPTSVSSQRYKKILSTCTLNITVTSRLFVNLLIHYRHLPRSVIMCMFLHVYYHLCRLLRNLRQIKSVHHRCQHFRGIKSDTALKSTSSPSLFLLPRNLLALSPSLVVSRTHTTTHFHGFFSLITSCLLHISMNKHKQYIPNRYAPEERILRYGANFANFISILCITESE